MHEIEQKPLVVSSPKARKLLGVGPTKFWELVRQKKIEMAQVGKRRMPTYASVEKLAKPR